MAALANVTVPPTMITITGLTMNVAMRAIMATIISISSGIFLTCGHVAVDAYLYQHPGVDGQVVPAVGQPEPLEQCSLPQAQVGNPTGMEKV